MTERISSTKNRVIQSFVKLQRARGRRDSNQILVEGPTLFEAALAAGLTPVVVLVLPDDVATRSAMVRYEDASLHQVTDRVLRAASDTMSPQSPVAVFERPTAGELRNQDTVVLVNVADPGNAGTIIRTAAAFGWDVAVTGHTVDIWSPKVLRSSAGAHFAANIVEIHSVIGTFTQRTHTVVATVARGGAARVASDRPIALLVGSEAHGLPADIVEAADEALTVPMPGGAESLNVAVAAALGMWITTTLE